MMNQNNTKTKPLKQNKMKPYSEIVSEYGNHSPKM